MQISKILKDFIKKDILKGQKKRVWILFKNSVNDIYSLNAHYFKTKTRTRYILIRKTN